jgi:hypothetical protein
MEHATDNPHSISTLVRLTPASHRFGACRIGTRSVSSRPALMVINLFTALALAA